MKSKILLTILIVFLVSLIFISSDVKGDATNTTILSEVFDSLTFGSNCAGTFATGVNCLASTVRWYGNASNCANTLNTSTNKGCFQGGEFDTGEIANLTWCNTTSLGQNTYIDFEYANIGYDANEWMCLRYNATNTPYTQLFCFGNNVNKDSTWRKNSINVTTEVAGKSQVCFQWNMSATGMGTGDDGFIDDWFVIATTITIIPPDTDAPLYSNNITSKSSGTEYSPDNNYGFQTNWTDVTGVDKVLFETDLNATLKNFTVSRLSGSATSGIYIINFTQIATGSYQYRWYANDTGGYMNASHPTVSYSISQNQTNPLNMSLYNGTTYWNQNLSASSGTQTTIQGFNIYPNSGTALLWRNGSSVSNPDTQTLAVGDYIYKTNTSGNTNYTFNDTGATFYVFINAVQKINHTINQTFSFSDQTSKYGKSQRSSIFSTSFTTSLTNTGGYKRIMSQGLSTSAITNKAQSLMKSISETFSAANVISNIRALPRAITDAFTSLSSIGKILNVFKLPTVQLNFNEFTSKTSAVIKSITQKFSTSLDTTIQLGKIRLVAITATFTDSMQRTLGILRTNLNSFSLTDVVQRIAAMPRQLTQSITTSAITDRLLNIIRPISQPFSLTGLASRIQSFPRSVISSFTTSALTDRLLNIFRPISQPFSLTDLTYRSRMLSAKLISQTLSISDSIFARAFISVTKLVDLIINFSDTATKLPNYVRQLTQTITSSAVADRLLDIFRPLSQTLSTTADTIRTKLLSRMAIQSINASALTDRLLNIFRPISQSLSLNGLTTRIQAFSRALTQSINASALTDRLLNIFRPISQPFSLTGLSIRIQSFPRPITDSFTTSALTDRLLNILRPLSQPFSLSDLTYRSRMLSAKLISQTLSISDSIFARAFISVTKLVDLIINFSDTATKLPNYVRQLTQTITSSAVADRLLDIFRPLSQTLSTTADTIRTKLLSRMAIQSINASALTDRLLNIFRPISQSLSLNGLTTRIQAFSRALTQSINASALTDRLLNIFRPISQPFSLTGLSIRIQSFPRPITDSFTTSALTDRLLNILRPLSQPFSLSDLTYRSRMLSAKLITQTLTISDSTEGTVTLIGEMVSRSVELIINLSDAISKLPTYVRQLIQSITISNITDRLFSLSRSISGSLSITANVIRFDLFSRLSIQSINTSAITDRVLDLTRAILQSFSTTADSIKLKSLLRQLPQTISLTDIVTRMRLLSAKLITQTLSISDFTEGTVTLIGEMVSRSVELIINLSDTISKLPTYVRQLIQSFSLTDLASRISTIQRQLIQSLSLSDFAQGIYIRFVQTFQRPVDLLMSLTGTISKTGFFSRFTTLNVGVTDSASRLFGILKTVAQSFGITDTIDRIKIFPRVVAQTFDLTQITARFASFIRPVSFSFQFILNILRGGTIKGVSMSFAIPGTTVPQGQFAEFDANVENTGTLSLTVSSGIGVYNSTDNLIATINSTNVTLPVGSRNTIVTFLSTLNLSTGSYKADAILFFDDQQTTNITKFFNITAAATLPIGNYTNSSINIAANTTTVITANTSTTTYVNMSILADANVTGVLALTEYSSVENQIISGYNRLSKFIDISISPNVTDNLQWAWLNISYIDAEVAVANLQESSLRIWFYNSTTSAWQQESNSGVDTSQNYVWANVTHLSLFGIFGTQISAPYVPPPSTGGGGGGGGGSTSNMTIKPLPTVAVEFVKWPVLREVVAGQAIAEGIRVKNKNNNTISNLYVEVSGIPASWVATTPQVLELSPGETEGFTLAISAPSDAAAGDYRVLVTLKSSGIEDSTFLILRVKSYAATYDKPIITRIVEIDKETKKSDVKLEISNPVRDYDKVEIDEDIPKSLAQSSDEIQFITSPTKIKQKDPLVSWSFFNFLAGTEKEIEYKLSKVPEEFTSLIYFPLKQISLTSEKVPAGLKIVEFNIPVIRPGDTAKLRLVVENIADADKKFEFVMETPSNWTITPDTISEIIKAGERKEFELTLKVPNDAQHAVYIVRAALSLDGDMVIREYRIEIGNPMFPLVIYVISGIAIAAVAFYLVRKYLSGRKIYVEYYVLTEEDKLRKIKKATTGNE